MIRPPTLHEQVEALPKQDWAEEKAREWLKKQRLTPKYYKASLAALLYEVRISGEGDTLAEVRRVVDGMRGWPGPGWCPASPREAAGQVLDEILSRLEKL